MTPDSSSTSILSSFSRNSFSRSSTSSSLCSSPNSFSSQADVTSFVPFLWEEKPGVCKFETRKFGPKMNGHCVLSSEKTESTVSTSLLPMADDSYAFPPLSLPPGLQKSSDSEFNFPRNNRDNKLTMARANAMSQSFSRRRQHRRAKSDEDPFWLAMKVCTNEGTGNFDPVRRGMKDADALLEEKDQRSLDFLFSFKVPVHRETGSAKKSVRTRPLRSSDPKSGMGDKQEHALQSSRERVVIPTFHRKGGQAMNGVVSLTALQSSRNSLNRHSFDRESKEFENAAYANGPKGICITVQAKQYTPQPVELSCGLRVKLKQTSNKQFLPGLLNCKSVNLFFNSVTDPTIYRGGKVSSREL